MAVHKSRSCLLLMRAIILFLLHFVGTRGLSFHFPSFNPGSGSLNFEGDSFISPGVIELTKNKRNDNLTSSKGRASYDKPVTLWNAKTGKLTDFMTNFTFVMDALDATNYGDGISFFIAPFDSVIPDNSSGGLLALFSPDTAFNNASANQLVAVEFDSFKNYWDPSPDHVGINVNSIVSVANVSWNTTMKDGRTASAWISYNSSTFNLSVFLTYKENPAFNGNSSLSYIVDLRKVLPERVRVGFAASTGTFVEIHNILSWSFNSTLEDDNVEGKSHKHITLAIALVVSFGVLACVAGLIWFTFRRKRPTKGKSGDAAIDVSMDDEFEKGTGPKKFTYNDLTHATNNFAEAGKLGEGGFGGVYKGFLSDTNTEVAVKRVSRGSRQGKKEYISEVKIISRLRHRNLVQLIGWCHEQGELLLVYEFLPNGSLDSHLFGGSTLLEWPVRYRIALGLASALLYLHEEWEQCVVHRDIKSSNVMLDSNFNAKLGDFGLARLVDHDLGSQTTVLAGTMGYLAPECVTTGKASKESDVYSFGVVALEIACGRKPVEPRFEPHEVRLVEWVWDLYGKGQIVEAADKRLSMEFDEKQVESLMVVGLWCCHPDHIRRPSIRQVINVLNFEAPLPSLPSKLPVPMYYAPPIDLLKFPYTSSGFPDTDKDRTQSSSSAGSTFTTMSGGSGKALLKSH